MDRPRLSLCLIFRDEEPMLPDFLASVAGLWDELVAVDTGSTDGSAALLAAAGARLSSFTWCDDFAAARNASLDRATGRWILFLDADERVTPELGRQISALLDDPEAGAATVVMRNLLPGGHRRESRLLRLFRNDPAIRFRHRIHEDVSVAVNDFLFANRLQLRHLSGPVDHLGYVREVAAGRNKKERDLALLRLSLEQDPADFYCRYKVLEIARFWNDSQLWQKEAARCAELLEGLDHRQVHELKQRHWSGELAALISRVPGRDAAEALIRLEATAGWAVPTAAWLLCRGNLCENLGRTDEAAASYQQCLDSRDEASSQLAGTRPLLGLCRLALLKGKTDEAFRLVQRALTEAPADAEALLAMCALQDMARQPDTLVRHAADHPAAALPAARALLSGGRLERAESLLRPLADRDPEAALGLLVACLATGRDFDGQVDVDQQEADRLLRGWVHVLWQSREPVLLETFAGNCGAVAGVFPWLPDFLAEETRQLREQSV